MNKSKIIDPISVDCVIFGFENETLKVLLIERIADKESGFWSLPGGYIRYDEDLEAAAERILEERTGVNVFMEQLGAFGDANRFPDRRIITIAFYALVNAENYKLSLEKDASEIKWVNAYDLPPLLFDHRKIILSALDRLRRKVKVEPIGFNLLPDFFPLLSLQRLYESILNVTYDKPNFRRKILKMGILVALDKRQEGVAYRSARLYKFNKRKYDVMVEKGYIFDM